MYDICALGELLIDFTPFGSSPAGNPLFERNPGGAVANVIAAASKLGLKTAFMGKVGNDGFGKFLEAALRNAGIGTKGLKYSDTVKTTLAFVQLDDAGDRSFSFYRNPGADIMYSEEDLDYDIIKDSRIFHFGSLSLTDEPSRTATYKALQFAEKNGLIISYDPNLRPMLWKSLEQAKREIAAGLKYADILKISYEEMEFITGEKSLEKGTGKLASEGITLIFVTLGPKGCFYRYGSMTGSAETYDTSVIDTTGAGDAFLGGVLYMLRSNDKQLDGLDEADIVGMSDFANAVGALTASRRGAISVMPSYEEVRRCMKEVNKVASQLCFR